LPMDSEVLIKGNCNARCGVSGGCPSGLNRGS
jgi:hypothetical protein